ncbi:ATP-binding protein [Flavobacterium jejuense]|uniref:ATP-binding protein n=1 Tax=Flavobacterium jejuense TaxID=1544455 RepID=A0ABX0IQ67_9FLAO|nr:ATP-binding protein [Flavobacterium jejuense]NHN25225.1 ATP-binding protein [Flavobacterium jejuense]
MDKEIIVLIGGPSSGKTTLINALTNKGYICYPEVSREIIQKAQNDGIEQLFLEQPLLFSELLLEGRINQYKQAKKESSEIVFIDRGLPDVIAYMDFVGNSYPEAFHKACLENKYSRVFVLPPWEEIYVSDKERYESYEEAVLIHKHLEKTYNEYGYQLIEVPKDSIENRVTFLMNEITK